MHVKCILYTKREEKLKSQEHILLWQIRILACIRNSSLNFLHPQSKLPCKMGVVSCSRKGKVDLCSDELIFKLPYSSIWNSWLIVLLFGFRSSGSYFINSARGYSGLFMLYFLEAEQKDEKTNIIKKNPQQYSLLTLEEKIIN